MKFTPLLLAALATFCVATPARSSEPGFRKSPEERALQELSSRSTSCWFLAGNSAQDCLCRCDGAFNTKPCMTDFCGPQCTP
ncbi:hypothetical protein LY76DRAFT_599667, partial [Colletotrichum caudatum]